MVVTSGSLIDFWSNPFGRALNGLYLFARMQMDLAKQSFGFNLAKGKRAVIGLILSVSVLFALVASVKFKEIQSGELERVILVFAIIFFVAFLAFFLKRLIISSAGKLHFEINESEILIPTFFLGVKKIGIASLYSIEKLLFKGEAIALILGVSNKGRIIIERQRFIKTGDFDQFYSEVENVCGRALDESQKEVICGIANKQAHLHLVATYALAGFMLCFYMLGLGNYLEYWLLGGNTKNIVLNAEYYRFFSSTFLHASFFHLFINIMILGIFGEFLERLISTVRFTNLFLLSNLFAIVVSFIFSDFEVSVGSSGGLFGFWGAYAYLKLRHENYLPGSINAVPVKKLYFVLVMEILLEIFVIDNIDYYNHLGGFLLGFVFLPLFSFSPRRQSVDQPALFEKGLFAILVSGYMLGLSYFLLLYYGVI